MISAASADVTVFGFMTSLPWNQSLQLDYITLDYMATIYMSHKPPSAPHSIGRSLNFAASAGTAVANTLLAPHGLGLAQWAVLVAIWRNGPLGVKHIADLTGNAPPAASRIVDRMVQNGLLVRQPDEQDRRAVVVNVSKKGESLRELSTVYETVNDILLHDLSDKEAELLFDLLDRVQAVGKAWLAENHDSGSA